MGTTSQSAIARVSAKSQSFYWPLRMFPADQANAIARLYGFCRVADDWADDYEPEEGRALLDRAMQDIKLGHSEIPEVADLLTLSDQWQVPLEPAVYLLKALFEDACARRMEDEAGLIRFCYGVAGVVGLLLNPILRVTDPRADTHAVDLGIAMQLSNIARDVVEDAGRDRVYLPKTWLNGVQGSESVLQPDASGKAELCQAVVRAVDLAEVYYQSAAQGYRFIPWRARLPIRVAGNFYREIGLSVARAPEGIWQQKVKPGRRQLMSVLLQQLVVCRSRYEGHSAPLHKDLQGMPGIQRGLL